MSLNATKVASLARGYTDRAMATLAKIMDDEETPPSVRVTAATALLDRGWGKPAQTISGDPENPVNIITRIERVIVDPVTAPPY